PTFANPTDHGWFTVPSMALPADDGTYLWRVRGWAPGGYSPWSAARLVTVDGDADPAPPPEDPGPVPAAMVHGPPDGAVNVDLAVTPIDWDTAPGVRYYDYQIQEEELPWTDPSP